MATMFNIKRFLLFVSTAVIAACGASEIAERQPAPAQPAPATSAQLDDALRQNADRMLAEGRETFRFDTFGSEDFWGGKLRLHNVGNHIFDIFKYSGFDQLFEVERAS